MHLSPLTLLLCHVDLNATPSQPLSHKVCFLNAPGSETEVSRGLALRTVSLPVLSQHPLGMFIGGLMITCVTF